jgi:undecaprenyl-diphosphatase
MFNSIILGIIQGVTEFLPISSSGHLVLFRDILGFKTGYDLSFDAVLQLATGLALVVYFWKDIWSLITSFFKMILNKPTEIKERTLIFAIILGTIPALIGGLLLEKQMDTIFRNLHLVAYILIAGSIVMYLAEKFSKQNSNLSAGRGFIIGLFQILALLPGFSRSGATISGGLFMGLSREQAARFSFLLSIPIIVGSGLLKLFELVHKHELGGLGLPLLVGSLLAFLTGLLVVHFLLKYLKNHKLDVFVFYRVLLAVLILIFI